ncbi:MAG TPA: hypothetical protein VLE73_00890 [Candidatus Saccharimonadales bacterium]|nr:hypothetical protein [Candidatus Saccharimonadales bacterium]
MTSFDGPLRAARAEVLPRIPELAPCLKKNPYAILEALEDTFTDDGHDIAAVPKLDWNKAERHTIAGFGIRKQAEYLVEGSGANAHFTQFRKNKKGEGGRKAFRKDIQSTLSIGAYHVRDEYTGGADAEHAWWPLAARRYRWLGCSGMRIMNYKAPDKSVLTPLMPLEGVFMHRALRTGALSLAVLQHLSTIRENGKDIAKEEHPRAAHDTAHITTTLAGLHIFELLIGNPQLPSLHITKDEETGLYLARHADCSNIRKVYPRFTQLPNVQLKCPAHVHPQTSGFVDREPSPLQNLFHAAINAAVEYEYDIL